jgi:hypothetical protein
VALLSTSTSLQNARLTDYDRAVLWRSEPWMNARGGPAEAAIMEEWDPSASASEGWKARSLLLRSTRRWPGSLALERLELVQTSGDQRRTLALDAYPHPPARGPEARRSSRAMMQLPSRAAMQLPSRDRQGADPRAGVTLMELLIAVSLVSLISVGILMAMRVGLNAMEKANNRLLDNRRVAGTQRIIEQQIAGLMAVVADCRASPSAPPLPASFFQGEPQSMCFVLVIALRRLHGASTDSRVSSHTARRQARVCGSSPTSCWHRRGFNRHAVSWA